MGNVRCKEPLLDLDTPHTHTRTRAATRMRRKARKVRHVIPKVIILRTGIYQLAVLIVSDFGELLGESRDERTEYLKGRHSHPLGFVLQMFRQYFRQEQSTVLQGRATGDRHHHVDARFSHAPHCVAAQIDERRELWNGIDKLIAPRLAIY